jgi:hypothetical protein
MATGLRGDRFCAVVSLDKAERERLRDHMEQALAPGHQDRLVRFRSGWMSVSWRRSGGSTGKDIDDPRIQAESGGIRVSTDPDGLEPVYAASHGEHALAASELLPVVVGLRAQGAKVEPEPAALEGLLTAGYVPAPLCAAKGVQRLEADSSLLLTTAGELTDPRQATVRALRPEDLQGFDPPAHPGRDPQAFSGTLRTVLAQSLQSAIAQPSKAGERPVLLLDPGPASRWLVGAGADLTRRPWVLRDHDDDDDDRALAELRLKWSPLPAQVEPAADLLQTAALALSGSISLRALSGSLDLPTLSRYGDRLMSAALAQNLFGLPRLSPGQARTTVQLMQGPSDPQLNEGVLGAELARKVEDGRAEQRQLLLEHLEGRERAPGGLPAGASYVVRQRDPHWELAPILLLRLGLAISLPYRDPRVQVLAGRLGTKDRRELSLLQVALRESWDRLAARDKPPEGWLRRMAARIRTQPEAPPKPQRPWWNQPDSRTRLLEAIGRQPSLSAVDPQALEAALSEEQPAALPLLAALGSWALFWNAADERDYSGIEQG